jgi:Domain of unknown function (DUF3597)
MKGATMSLFSTILEKLGLKHPLVQPTALKPAATVPHATPQVEARPVPAQQTSEQPPTTHAEPKPNITPQQKPEQATASQAWSMAPAPPAHTPEQHPASEAKPITSAAPVAIPIVDVVSKLEGLAAANPYKLDWKVSIVALLKLLGKDSSFEARKALAIELGCPAEKMGDSAQMNTWLHQTVLQKIADNGGNIPKELLD